MKKPGFVGALLWFVAACGGDSGPEVTVVSSSLDALICTQTMPMIPSPAFSWEFPNCRGVYDDLVNAGLLAPSGTGVTGDFPDLAAGLAFRFGQGVPLETFNHRAVFPEGNGKEGERLFVLKPFGGRPVLSQVKDGEAPAVEMTYEQTQMGVRISEVKPHPDVTVHFDYQMQGEQLLYTGKTITAKPQQGQQQPQTDRSTITHGQRGNKMVPVTVVFGDSNTLTAEYRDFGGELVMSGFNVRAKDQRVVQNVTYEYQVLGGQVQLTSVTNEYEVEIDATLENQNASQPQPQPRRPDPKNLRKERITEVLTLGYRQVGGRFLPATVVASSQKQKATTTYDYADRAGELVLSSRKVENPDSIDTVSLNYQEKNGHLRLTDLTHNITPLGSNLNAKAETATIRFVD